LVPGPVQDSCSRFWPGHQISRVNFYFKKIQNDVVLIKIKVYELQPGFAESAGSHRIMSFSIFSSTRPGFSFKLTRFWINPPAEFQNYSFSILRKNFINKKPWKGKGKEKDWTCRRCDPSSDGATKFISWAQAFIFILFEGRTHKKEQPFNHEIFKF